MFLFVVYIVIVGGGAKGRDVAWEDDGCAQKKFNFFPFFR